MFKKLFVGALALLMIVGCSSNSGNGDTNVVTELKEPVEITFWHAMNGKQEEALKKLTDDFMASNDKVKVVLQNQSSYPDLQQKITATLGSPNNLPTITQAYPAWLYNASLDKMLQDFTPYINNKEIGMTDADDIVKGFWEGAQLDGVQYGIPFNKSSEALFYNKDLFEKAGIEAPKTWEEFIAAAKAITEKTGVVGGGFDSLNNYYVTQMKEQGVDFNDKLDVTSDKSVTAVDTYLQGVKDGYLRIAGSDKYLSGPFGNQLIAMNIGSTAGESYVRKGAEGKFTPGAVPVPVSSKLQQGTDIYMFNNATDEQKTASYLFIKYLVSAEAQLHWAKETGYLPVRTSVMESAEYTSLDSLIAPIAKEITAQMFTIPVSANSNAAYLEISTMMESVLSDKNSDVKAKLDDLSKTLKSIWAE